MKPLIASLILACAGCREAPAPTRVPAEPQTAPTELAVPPTAQRMTARTTCAVDPTTNAAVIHFITDEPRALWNVNCSGSACIAVTMHLDLVEAGFPLPPGNVFAFSASSVDFQTTPDGAAALRIADSHEIVVLREPSRVRYRKLDGDSPVFEAACQ